MLHVPRQGLIKRHIIVAALCCLTYDVSLSSLTVSSTHAFIEKAHDKNYNNQLTVSTLSFMHAPVGNKLASVILNEGGTLHINMLSADGDS